MAVHFPRVHNRQFVIGPQPVKPVEDWVSIVIEDDRILSHCPRLTVDVVPDQDGSEWILLGLAAQTVPDQPSPQDAIRSTPTSDIPNVYESWAGRWVLVGNGEIHLDACGLLGCFYRTSKNEDGKSELWVSSSLALLTDLPGRERLLACTSRLFILGAGLDWWWDPPPRTKYEGVRKLLPSQILNLSTAQVRPRLLSIPGAQELSYEGILSELENLLLTSLKNIHRQGDEIWIAVTSGYDSRLLLAAAHKANLPARTYTFLNPYRPQADRTLPPRLSHAAGFEHSLISPQFGPDGRLQSLFDEHSAQQNILGADRLYVARGQWGQRQPAQISLRGLCFEVGRCYFGKKLPPASRSGALPAAKTIARRFEQNDPAVIEWLNEYLKWVSGHPIANMDWRDRFYIENRLAGWASAVEQSLDCVAGTRFVPANSRRMYRLLLALPESKRCTSQHHVDLINSMAPQLLDYPFNPKDTRLQNTARRLRKFSGFLGDMGLSSETFRLGLSLLRSRFLT